MQAKNTQALPSGSMLRNNTYRIEKVIGNGGFGITYLATDIFLDKKVAIKEFFLSDLCNRQNPDLTMAPATENSKALVDKLKEKFIKEAKNIAKLEHPGIVRILTSFEENNTAYYVMDYIEGESLYAMLKRQGTLPQRLAVKYITRVGETLGYIHSKNMNHLDVKPANIMIRRSDDMPILIDFGTSKQYDSMGNQTSTTPTGLTHGFAPLEQYQDGGVKEFSPQTDLYSLAATLYDLVSGKVPPQATQIFNNGLSFPDHFPETLKGPIDHAMRPRKDERHKTVKAFIYEIQLTPTSNNTVITTDVGKTESGQKTLLENNKSNNGEATYLDPRHKAYLPKDEEKTYLDPRHEAYLPKDDMHGQETQYEPHIPTNNAETRYPKKPQVNVKENTEQDILAKGLVSTKMKEWKKPGGGRLVAFLFVIMCVGGIIGSIFGMIDDSWMWIFGLILCAVEGVWFYKMLSYNPLPRKDNKALFMYADYIEPYKYTGLGQYNTKNPLYKIFAKNGKYGIMNVCAYSPSVQAIYDDLSWREKNKYLVGIKDGIEYTIDTKGNQYK